MHAHASPGVVGRYITVTLPLHLQVESADGCHLDRQTLSTVRAAGFASVDAEVIDLRGFWVLSPTAAGIAVR